MKTPALRVNSARHMLSLFSKAEGFDMHIKKCVYHTQRQNYISVSELSSANDSLANDCLF